MRRNAFTLIEVLISIALLSFVLLALYKSVNTLQSSNRQLFDYIEKADLEKKATETMFLDIAGSDGNLSIAGDEYSRLCLEKSVNSLYGRPVAKVCWVVSKEEGNTLLRSEGLDYTLPLNSDDMVSVDAVMENIDLFRVYRNKESVLVLLRKKGKKSISFMVQGVPRLLKKKKVKKVKKNRNKQKGPPRKSAGNTPGKSVPMPPGQNKPAV